MNQIVGEAEAERQREIEHTIRTERHARIFGRVPSVFIFLFLAALWEFGYNYRDALAKLCNSKSGTKIEGKAPGRLPRPVMQW